MRITYVGHATIEIADSGCRLLTDPLLRGHALYLRRIVPRPVIDRLRRPDAVLISHAHFDHLDFPSLRLASPKQVLAPRGCGALLRRAGFSRVTEIAPGEQLEIAGIRVTATRLAHDGRRHPLSRARDTLGYVIESDASAFV